MKKIYVILAAVVAAMMVLSCQKSEEVQAPVENNQNLKTFKAIFPSDDADSKVTLDNAGKTKWAIGDVITIHGKATDELKTVTLDGVSNTISADGKTATFTVALDMTPDDYGSDGFYAQYPHSAYAEYESNRPRYFNCFNDTNTLLLSGVYDGTDTFVFYNVSGALSFIVDGSSFGGFDEYMIVGKNDELVGYNHFNTRVATGAFAFYHYSSSGAKNSVKGVVVDDGTTVNTVYFPVTEEDDTADNPGKRATCVDFTNGFYIYFLKDKVITHMASTSEHVRIERQRLTKLGVIPTSKIKEYSAPTEHIASHPAITGAEDLGATAAGTANCYVVRSDVAANANKVFKFKAVRGNSNTNVGDINSVSILWETYNTESSVTPNSIIAQADFDRQGGSDYYITFKMPATLKAGNAVIAAKDIYGRVLWSWHIWVPKTNYSTDDYGISSVNLMSRNLGALDDTKAYDGETKLQVDLISYGLYYQWGRKDPFVGPKSTNSSSIASVSGEAWVNTETAFTLEQSYGKPTERAKFNAWNEGASVDPWGNAGDKTINDPCPPGYRVPKYNESDALWQHLNELAASYNFEANSDYGWWKVGTAVFPLSGYIEGSSVSGNKSRGKIWTATRLSGYDQHGITQYLYWKETAWDSQPTWGTRRFHCVPVRCAAE